MTATLLPAPDLGRMTKADLANKLGRTWPTVRSWLKRAGVSFDPNAKTLPATVVLEAWDKLGGW